MEDTQRQNGSERSHEDGRNTERSTLLSKPLPLEDKSHTERSTRLSEPLLHEDGRDMERNTPLSEHLKKMFDIEGATIEKTQYCPVGRWAFTLPMTALFSALYGTCMWGVRLFYGSLQIFLYCLLTAAFAFGLFRVWLGFFADLRGQRSAEKTTFLRHGDKRYYYTEGRAVEKFEYGGGGIAVTGKSYERMENKSDYSPLAGRYNKALLRRSSLYAVMTPAFWCDMLRDMPVSVTAHFVIAVNRDADIRIECDASGKIKQIDYFGNGYLLYDSLSPVKIFDGKLPGKYRIRYTFCVAPQSPLVLPPVFGAALKEYGMPTPLRSCVKIKDESESAA